MTKIYNKTSEKRKRQSLRNRMPEAEIILWSQLRLRKQGEYKFRRQFSVGPYILDFYCPEVKLAIEVDGESHFTPEAERYDKQRQKAIETFGIQFLRFTNSEVKKNLRNVLEVIRKTLEELHEKKQAS